MDKRLKKQIDTLKNNWLSEHKPRKKKNHPGARNYVERCHIIVGRNILAARTKLGLTQHDLADRTPYDRGTVANIETGRHRFLLNVVETFAKALKTTPQRLMKGVWD